MASQASPRFRRLRVLGEGGMGVVYEAHDDLRGARVALKTIRAPTPAALARFKREFRVLQSVHHPNLVTLGELVTEGDECFFTMELIDGEDFVTHVRAPGADRDARLRRALVQLAEGLAALHAGGIVHRDIKPANVLVARDGRTVLLDFGLATELRSDGAATRGGVNDHVVGTPAYMAPEQAASGAVGPEADWYAVGSMLYEALAGRVPFAGAPLEMLLQKQRATPPSPSTIANDAAPDLSALCDALLRFDPAARPTGARVLRTLGGDGAGAALASAQTTEDPFVGRASELDALDRAFRASHGHPIVALVSGEPGVGKSSLVARFVERLAVEERDLVVLAGQCWEEGGVAYNALDGIAFALARQLDLLSPEDAEGCLPESVDPLVTIFPALGRARAVAARKEAATNGAEADRVDLRGRAFSALRELLTRLAEKKTLLFVIDDVHWIDGDSLALLTDVLRMPDAPPVMLVATMRTARDASGSIGRGRDALPPMGAEVREIEVGRLPAGDAHLLALALLARAAPSSRASATAIAEVAHGHPLTIDVLVRGAMDRDKERDKERDEKRGDGDARTPDSPSAAAGHPALDDALWLRVTRLSPSARAIVTLVAVAGAPVPRAILAGALPDRTAFVEDVAFLRVSRLVTTSGDRERGTIAPYHETVRAAVLARLSEAEKRDLHRQLALALATAEAPDVDALFTHARGAGDAALAAKYAQAAADRATHALAFNRASTLYQAALALGTYDATTTAALNEQLGDAHGDAGRGAEAARAYRAAARDANTARALDLRSRAAAQLLRSGHFDEGFDAAAEVLREVGLRFARSPLTALVTLLLFRALFALRGLGFRRREASRVSPHALARIDVCSSIGWQLTFADPTQGTAFQQRYLLLALQCGEPTRVVRALASEFALSGAAGTRRWARTSALVTSTRELADSVGDARASAIHLQATASATYLGHGDFAGALALSDQAEAALRGCSGVAWELSVARLYGLYSLVYLGRWDELGVRCEQFLRDARARGNLFSVVNGSTGVATCAWLGSDDPGRARRNTADALHTWPKSGFHLAHYHEALGLAFVDLYEGCGDDALARLEAVWPKMQRSFYLRVQALRIEGLDARARAMLAVAKTTKRKGERAQLLARARQIAHRLNGERSTWGTAMAWLLEAGASHLTGTPDDTEHLLQEAALACDRAGMALHATVARWCAASLDGRAKEPRAPVKNFERVVALLAPTFGPG